METDRIGDGLARFEDSRFGFRIVKLCRGKVSGKSFFAFIGIEPQNYPYFLEHYRDGIRSDFQIFGCELLRGWGDDPPEDIIRYMQEKFHVEFEVDQSEIMQIAKMTASMMQEGWTRSPVPFQNLNPPNTSGHFLARTVFPES